MKSICLVVGHKESSQGASNRRTGITEYRFNDMLATDIRHRLKDMDIKIVHRRSYHNLPTLINIYNPDYIVSLHCNAFNQKATGTEVLYYHKSKAGRRMATILQRHLTEALGLADRGIKPKGSEDRGGYLLRHTHAPCVIAEPFFIDNDDDLKASAVNREDLISAYVEAIREIAA